MRIGVLFSASREGGGVFQYSTTLVRALADLGLPDEVVVFYPEGAELPAELTELALRTVEMPPDQTLEGRIRRATWRFLPSSLRRLASSLVYGSGLRRGLRRHVLLGQVTSKSARTTTDWFRRFGLDLMVYPQPDKRCFQLGIPYVVSVHDLQHRLQPEFPEVASGGLWEAREYLFGNAIRDAAVVLTDSETGRGDVLTCYRDLGAREDRVRALPFLPPTYLREDVSESERAEIRARYGLPSSYLFYPAQFWSHKNHGRLVEAVAALVGDGIDAHLVLVGSHAGRDCERVFADVCGAARRLSVRDRVLHLGYVPDDDMSGLYAMAECLVMPTFFGPTNIPILEAFTVGCPVVVSDIPGEREQVGDAGILVDPKSVESIAAGIRRLFTEPGLREELAHRGRVRIAGYTREDYLEILAKVIQEAKDRTARPAMDQPVCLPKPEGRGSETLAK